MDGSLRFRCCSGGWLQWFGSVSKHSRALLTPFVHHVEFRLDVVLASFRGEIQFRVPSAPDFQTAPAAWPGSKILPC